MTTAIKTATQHTMIICNTMGAVVVRHINIHEMTPNDKGVKLIYSMKRSKKKMGFNIKKNETSLVLVEGFQAAPATMVQDGKKAQWFYDDFVSFDAESFEDTVNKFENIIYSH
jgi:hypothetical protein